MKKKVISSLKGNTLLVLKSKETGKFTYTTVFQSVNIPKMQDLVVEGGYDPAYGVDSYYCEVDSDTFNQVVEAHKAVPPK